jgi:outer membrane protein assembly factor BamB
MPRRLMFLAAIVSCCAPALGADWPQYLGPNRNATSEETGLLRAWPPEGPKVLWTVPLGEGFGGPAVSEGKVYVLDRVPGESDVLRCFDLATGEALWSFEYPAPGETSYAGSRSVPAVDGNYVYTCGPFGDVYCFDKTTHKPVWNKNVWKDFGGGAVPTWAVSQNPLVYDNLLILASQTESTGVVAYEKLTGEVAWASSPLPGKVGYVSPTLVTIDGQDQVVAISAGPPPGSSEGGEPGAVVGLDPQSGKTLWSYRGWQCKIPVPNVTAIGDGRLFITGGYRAGSVMIKVERQGAGFAVAELYKTPDFGTHAHPPVLYKGHLYGQCSTNETKDGMVCMDLDGNVKWKTKRSPAFDKGGLLLADGLIFSSDGSRTIYLIEPSPEGFRPLASAELLETRTSWAPLALSDGKLLVRDQKQLKCLAVR